jgi:ferredoxin, 2Fe-2S
MITINFIAHNASSTGATTKISTPIGKSLMQAAQQAGVDGIAADCGGSLTCATCHVMVQEPWASQLPPANADERAMLEFTATPCQPQSRLACQIQLTDALDGLTVDLPTSQY